MNKTTKKNSNNSFFNISSKSLDRKKIYSKRKREPKLRANNFQVNFSINKENTRAKSKFDQKYKTKKLFSSINNNSKRNLKPILKHKITPFKVFTEQKNDENKENRGEDYFFRTNLITMKLNLKKNDGYEFRNLKYVKMNDTSSIFNEWRNISTIYKAFEKKLLEENGFKINTQTLQIITRNSKSSKDLKNQKFWILYIEYLFDKHMILNEETFLSVINEAFSYMEKDDDNEDGYPFYRLKNYYLEKSKKCYPCFLDDGTFDDNEETYLKKLNKSAYNLIYGRNNFNFLDEMKLH